MPEEIILTDKEREILTTYRQQATMANLAIQSLCSCIISRAGDLSIVYEVLEDRLKPKGDDDAIPLRSESAPMHNG